MCINRCIAFAAPKRSNCSNAFSGQSNMKLKGNFLRAWKYLAIGSSDNDPGQEGLRGGVSSEVHKKAGR